MLRVCLDLNVWVGAFLSEKLGRRDTAAQSLVAAVRSGSCALGPVALVVSWGMLHRLEQVLSNLGFYPAQAQRLVEILASYAREGPTLTLGAVGVLPMDDEEDRHVLETALAAVADILVTHNLSDFIAVGLEELVPDRWYARADAAGTLVVAHTYEAAAWLRGEPLPEPVRSFRARHGIGVGPPA